LLLQQVLPVLRLIRLLLPVLQLGPKALKRELYAVMLLHW
jgi:hypothetical protein